MGFHTVTQKPSLHHVHSSWSLFQGRRKPGVLPLLCFGLEVTHITSALSLLAEHEDLPNYKGQRNVKGRLQNGGEH